MGICLTRSKYIVRCVVVFTLLLLFPVSLGADDIATVLQRIAELQRGVDRLNDMVSVLSVSSTTNIVGELDNIRAKIVALQDQVTVLQRGIGQITGADPSIEDTLLWIKERVMNISKRVDAIGTTGYAWNGTSYGQTQMGMLSISVSPQRPKRGDYFSLMVFDAVKGVPAAGVMVQGPGIFMMGMGGGMSYPGMQYPSFGYGVTDVYGLVYGQWPGGRASFTARSQDGKFGSLVVGGGGGVVAWVLAIVISIILVFVSFYVYYRRQLGLGGMSV